MKEEFGMQLDKNHFSKAEMMQFTIDTFESCFGNDIELMDSRYSNEVGGYYHLEYHYLPKKYKIVFEHEKLFFSIRIIREDGAFTSINQICDGDIKNGLREENINDAIEKLANNLNKSTILFYKIKNNKLVEKK